MRILSSLFVLGLLTAACGGPGSEQAVSPSDVTTAQAALTGFTVSPSAVNFGNQSVGTTSAPQTVTLYNGSTGVVQLMLLWSDGMSAFDPRVDGYNWELQPGASTSFTLAFTPTSAQTYTGTASVYAYPAGSGSPTVFSVSVTGTGTSP